MSVEYFLNTLESVINSTLIEVSDLARQKKEWFQEKNAPFPVYDTIIEEFLEEAKFIIGSKEYALFANAKACQSLKALYEKMNDFYLCLDIMQVEEDPKTLVDSPKWIEIAKAAKETIELLEKFIREERAKCQKT